MYWARTDSWYLERIIWLVAGTFTLLGTLLAWLVSPWWLLLTGLVGVNLLIFAFTGFCIMANILTALGARSRVNASPAAAPASDTQQAPSS